VVQEIDDRQTYGRRIQVPRLDRGTRRTECPIGAWIMNGHRHIEGADGSIQVVALEQMIDPPPDETGLHAKVRGQFAFEPGRSLPRALVLKVRVKPRAPHSPSRAIEQTLF